MKAILPYVGGFLVCLAWSAPGRAQVPAAGYLVNTLGKWTAENGSELKLGSAVFPGEVLRSAGTGAVSITIAYLNGGLETYPCQSKDPCVYHVKDIIPEAVSWPEQILLALKNLAARRQSMPVNAISRDVNALRLRPGVLPLNENVLDLKAAVTLLDPGAYQFQLKPLVIKAGRQNALVTGPLLWDDPRRTVADVSDWSREYMSLWCSQLKATAWAQRRYWLPNLAITRERAPHSSKGENFSTRGRRARVLPPSTIS